MSIPVNLTVPTISGTPKEGVTLTSTPGTWTNNPTSFRYQWANSMGQILGATQPTYVLVSADVGLLIQLFVVAINSSGASVVAKSAGIGPVTAADPVLAFPGQPGNLVGHTAAPGYPGSLTPMSINGPFVNGTAGNPTVYSFKDFDGGTGGLYLDGSRQYIKFVGCRFQSNSLNSSNISTAGAIGITWDFCTISPRVALVAAPPSPAWPASGAGQGSATTAPPTLYQIPYIKGYQYGLNLSTAGAGGPYTITNCDIWGFQNAITFYGTAQPIIVDNCWIHDCPDQGTADGDPQSAHQDGPGYLNAGVGPTNLQITHCTIAAIANGNGLAFQGGSPSANGMTIDRCFIAGWAVPIFLGGVINTKFTNNILGSDLPYRFVIVHSDYTTAFRANGNMWSGNKFRKLAGTVPYPGAVPQWTSGQDGYFIWPDGLLRVTDFT